MKEFLIARRPSHFQVNPLVKIFILSEMFLWSAWNFTMPIFAIFASNDIKGGNVKIAASAYSIYLLVRIIAELLAGKKLLNKTDTQKVLSTLLGILIIAISYFGFASVTNIIPLFICFGLTGLGMGISAPAKLSLFSDHLDKGKEPLEWSFYDAVTFTGMALSAALGGFIASEYGFRFLFILSAVVNLLAIIPYFAYFKFKVAKTNENNIQKSN